MNVVQQHSNLSFQSIKYDVKGFAGAEQIERALFEVLGDSTGAVREMCSHILNAGGKRVRPLLVMYSGLAFSKPSHELLQASVSAELIHMASLVHDDIIDNSGLRRSKPSINKVWGNHFAVLCGDYLFARAFGILSGAGLSGCMKYMVEAIENMCSGEVLQAGHRFNLEVDLQTYYDIIAKKTAIFLQCCCKAGAFISGADDRFVNILGEYGLNLGYAFQIIDDMLDYCGSSGVMGKPRMEDFRQGCMTMPLIFLLQNETYGQRAGEILVSKECTDETVNEITSLLQKSGSIEETFCMAVKHIKKAREALKLLPWSESVDFLFEVTNLLQARMN